nr:unnamed protein product [Callosobruchus analis]
MLSRRPKLEGDPKLGYKDALQGALEAKGMGADSGGEPPTGSSNPDDRDTLMDLNQGISLDSIQVDSINIQTVSTDSVHFSRHPEINAQRRPERPFLLYKQTDMGPFQVYAENNSPDFTGKLNPIKVGDIILKYLPEIHNQIKKK